MERFFSRTDIEERLPWALKVRWIAAALLLGVFDLLRASESLVFPFIPFERVAVFENIGKQKREA